MVFTPSPSGVSLGHARSQGPRFGSSSCHMAAICALQNADMIELTDLPGMEVATLLMPLLSTRAWIDDDSHKCIPWKSEQNE